MSEPNPSFRSVVLAGERPGGGDLARVFNVSCGAMVPVAGKPSLERVLNTLESCQLAAAGIVCGPAKDVVETDDGLQRLLLEPWRWLAPAEGPAASAQAAVRALGHFPVLLTAGDHALLTPEIVDGFCRSASARSDADIVIGMVPFERVRAAWPDSKRTVSGFSDGGFCGANLFAVLSPAGCDALAFWSRVEHDRKRPWRIARRLGVSTLLHYLFRRLALEDALNLLSEKAGCRVRHVLLDDPRAAVDVDTVADQRLAEKILSAN